MARGCIEWQKSRRRFGYGQQWDSEARKVVLAHRKAWRDVHGPIPDGLCVLHKCDNPPCVNVDHLYLGTYKDNSRDKKERGREPDVVGEKNPNCKLTDKQVGMMKRLRSRGWIQVRLARRFGVTQAHVSKILRGVFRG